MDQRTQGFLGELEVERSLIKQGFFVFKCTQDGSPFDLVAYKKNLLHPLRVEVKCSGLEEDRGNLCYKVNLGNNLDINNFDFLAVSLYKEEKIVWFRPEELSNTRTLRVWAEKLEDNGYCNDLNKLLTPSYFL